MRQLTFSALLLFSATCLAQDETEAIAKLLGTTFDKPEAQVVTHAVVVSGNHAIADWTQGHHGGRALLSKREGRWKVVSCGGSGFKHKTRLVSAGVPASTAEALVEKLSKAEASLDPKRVRMFDAFSGVRAH
ncbi:MAG: copper uptake system-associated protein [Methylophilaceae bacterium]|nr:copper uptake system-associated protein [Methylophilaceae bacterium]